MNLWYIINKENAVRKAYPEGDMMMYILKRGIGLLLAVSLLMLCASGILMVQTPVRAYDSGDYSWVKDETDLKEAVNDLPSPSHPGTAAQKKQIQAVADRLSELTERGKRNASESVIKKLAKYYNTAFGLSPIDGKEDIDLVDTDETSKKRIDEDNSYAYGVMATFADGSSAHRLRVEQYKSSGSVLLKMDLKGFEGPVYVDFKLKGSPFSSSKDYYLRLDGSSTHLDVNVGSNHIRFIAPTEGEYRLYKSSDDDDDDDYDYDNLSSFWQDVVDDIEDAGSGSRVRVDLGSRTTVPTDVLRALKGRSVTMALYESNGNIISIYGKDVKIPSGSSVSLSTLRNTYDKKSSSSRSSSSSSSSSGSTGSIGTTGGTSSTGGTGSTGSGGLPVTGLPNGIGGLENTTVAGGTGTPNAGGAPTSAFPSVGLPVSPLPTIRTPSSTASSSSSSASETELKLPSASRDTDYRETSGPEGEQVAIQEPFDFPEPDVLAGSSRIGRVVDRVGLAGVLAFLGLAGITAALGGGLLTYAILSHRDGK